jgi:cell division protein FtsB
MKDSKSEIQRTKQYLNSNFRISKTSGFLSFCCLNLFRVSRALLLCSCALMHFAAGCDTSNRQALLAEQIEQLTEQNTQLTRQIEQSESESDQLRKQVQVLSALPQEVRLDNLYELQRIKIGRLTGMSDKDEDGKVESLIVYVQPIDEEGDIIKASGVVDVQLWDLNNANGEALLGQWHVEPDELKRLWVAFVVLNYRLTLDVADKIKDFKEPLTVKVTFTDYLTGKVFKEQKVIKPQSP